MSYKPKSENDLAGITAVQSETFNYVFGITRKDKKYYLVLERTEDGSSEILASKEIELKDELKLRVEAEEDDYQFSYALDSENFENLGGIVSGDILSTNVAGGFTGNMIGLYATSANDAVPE
jgi:alpha-N-arabinofuranosidase